jgi:ferredoxin/flavodoxin---NADP+ reductase
MGKIKPATLNPTKVLSIRETGKNAWIISIPKKDAVQAGQVIALTTDPEIPRRLYSLCNGENDTTLSFLFDVKKEGLLTPRLSHLRPGSEILVSKPHGNFLILPGPDWMIATGTGIAPFRSALRSGKASGKTLIHGAAYRDSFYFSDEFASDPSVSYIQCCSREKFPGSFHGRVTGYLEKATLHADIKYYLCGRTEMIVEVRDLLIRRGIPFGQIITEIYF